MKHAHLYSLVTGVALAALCGCQSLGTIARGQSPQSEPLAPAAHHSVQAIQQDPHVQRFHQGLGEIRQHYVDHHAQDTSFYYETIPGGPTGGDVVGVPCPGGACPSGYCPAHGHCPSGHCSSCGGFGNGLTWYPKHRASYSFNRPSDLVYPPANVPGGAVVYPYYTHKGPSDFFRE